jgi:hypothetical protein
MATFTCNATNLVRLGNHLRALTKRKTGVPPESDHCDCFVLVQCFLHPNLIIKAEHKCHQDRIEAVETEGMVAEEGEVD